MDQLPLCLVKTGIVSSRIALKERSKWLFRRIRRDRHMAEGVATDRVPEVDGTGVDGTDHLPHTKFVALHDDKDPPRVVKEARLSNSKME
jgi:hypothetical protein